jgi:hypothetical protein
MAPVDPRWLELLKSSGGQSLAFAAASGGLLLAIYFKLLPPLDPPWIHLVVGLCILGIMLWVASVLGVLNSFFSPRLRLAHWSRVRQQRKAVEKYIPFMTDKEKKIIGYLLKYNRKTFTAATDGGHAVTLISRGIVVRQMIGGQQASAFDVPMGVPDHVWEVLEKHRDMFPHKPEMNRGTEVHPWRERLW